LTDDVGRYTRQILAFGEGGDRKLRATSVAIVGLGGLGSQITQALAYLGVRKFLLVDDDRVSASNLNRLVGATPGDAKREELKVKVAERLVLSVAPDAEVRAIPVNLRSVEALTAIPGFDVVFGCVDRDGSRLILTELCAAYLLPLVDIAAEIIVVDGREPDFGGRVLICRPGEYCIDCADQLDRNQAKWDLSSDDARATRAKHGYGLGDAVSAPAVVSLNGTLANIAVTEFALWRSGLREPHRHITHYGFRGKTAVREDTQRKQGCYTCEYLLGSPERANLSRFLPKAKE
jgi:molybdopterin/thiamine biosynthesis adenylyltransferase